MSLRTVQCNLRLPAGLLAEVDRRRAVLGMSRDALAREVFAAWCEQVDRMPGMADALTDLPGPEPDPERVPARRGPRLKW